MDLLLLQGRRGSSFGLYLRIRVPPVAACDVIRGAPNTITPPCGGGDGRWRGRAGGGVAGILVC
jgi:hypothetical protein